VRSSRAISGMGPGVHRVQQLLGLAASRREIAGPPLFIPFCRRCQNSRTVPSLCDFGEFVVPMQYAIVAGRARPSGARPTPYSPKGELQQGVHGIAALSVPRTAADRMSPAMSMGLL
jgi:hypothetical protein